MPTESIRCCIVKIFFPHKIAEKLCPNKITDHGECWKCRTKIPFMIPRRGYSNGSGSCSECGARYTLFSNYGLVTLFPPGVMEDYAVELSDRVLESITPEEARDVLQQIDE